MPNEPVLITTRFGSDAAALTSDAIANITAKEVEGVAAVTAASADALSARDTTLAASVNGITATALTLDAAQQASFTGGLSAGQVVAIREDEGFSGAYTTRVWDGSSYGLPVSLGGGRPDVDWTARFAAHHRVENGALNIATRANAETGEPEFDPVPQTVLEVEIAGGVTNIPDGVSEGQRLRVRAEQQTGPENYQEERIAGRRFVGVFRNDARVITGGSQLTLRLRHFEHIDLEWNATDNHWRVLNHNYRLFKGPEWRENPDGTAVITGLTSFPAANSVLEIPMPVSVTNPTLLRCMIMAVNPAAATVANGDTVTPSRYGLHNFYINTASNQADSISATNMFVGSGSPVAPFGAAFTIENAMLDYAALAAS